MKLVAVTRVRNEADIIEPFVRHTCAHFHKLIVLDDGSSDDTPQILRSMRATGLPVVIVTKESIVYDQSRYMTLLLQMAVNQFGADWVMPLDADEFIEPPHDVKLTEWLSGFEPRVLLVPWSDFVWDEEASFNSEINPVLRLRMRLPPRWDQAKVMIPAHLVTERVQVAQGNDALVLDGKPVPTVSVNDVHICHYPVRDPVQYAGKTAVGFLKYQATSGWDRLTGFQYMEPFEALLKGGMEAIVRRMPHDSRYYGMKTFPDDRKPKEMPLQYCGGPVAVPSRQPLLSNVLYYAKALANEYSVVFLRHQALAATIGVLKNEQAAMFEQMGRLSQASTDRILQLTEHNAALEKRASELELELFAAHELNFLQSVRLSSRTYRLLDRINRRLTEAGLAPKRLADFVFSLLRFK